MICNVLMQLLLFCFNSLRVSLIFDLFFLKLVDLVLLFLDFFLLLHKITLDFDNLSVESSLCELEVVNLLLFGLNFLLKLLLLSDELVDGVVLTKRETRALLDNLVELSNLILQTLDDLPSLFFLFLGGLNKFPALFNLTSQNSDSVRIFLSELDGTFDSCSILQDRVIELLTSFNESLFTLIGCLEGSVQFLVFLSELLHRSVSDELL